MNHIFLVADILQKAVILQMLFLRTLAPCFEAISSSRSRSGASLFSLFDLSLRTADAFPVVASLPPKNSLRTADAFPVVGGREATTGNASTVRRLLRPLPLVKSFAIFSSTQLNHRAIVFA